LEKPDASLEGLSSVGDRRLLIGVKVPLKPSVLDGFDGLSPGINVPIPTDLVIKHTPLSP